MRPLFHNAILIKALIAIGLISTYFLPQYHSIVIGISANMLWLWKV